MASQKRGAEDARAHLPEILERAHRGETTIVTMRGRPYAAVVPVETALPKRLVPGILALRGTGRGCWGARSVKWVARLRDEW